MTSRNRDFYRSRAIARRRDPEQDARIAAEMATRRAKVDALLADLPLIQQLNAAAEARGLPPQISP